MTDRAYLPDPEFVVGEPYEFPDHRWEPGKYMRYRCWRGKCAGKMTPLTADRNTHNGYHNRKGD